MGTKLLTEAEVLVEAGKCINCGGPLVKRKYIDTWDVNPLLEEKNDENL